jgi:hypothetical protein
MTDQGLSKTILMEEEGWTLSRLEGPDYKESSCWAQHHCEAGKNCKDERTKTVYGWYPRDNGYFGACCYCGAGCPEGMMAAFLMMNSDILHEWDPCRWNRRSPSMTLDTKLQRCYCKRHQGRRQNHG